MTTSAPSGHGRFLAVRPACEAYDYDYFLARLADPGLVQESLAIRLFRVPLLAVPVGGLRRGGRFGTEHAPLALAVRDVLRGRPGFPDLRVRRAPVPWGRGRWSVEWGDPLPQPPTRQALHQFYGYTGQAPGGACRLARPA